MRVGAYLLGAQMSRAIGIEIAVPLDSLVQAVIAAALGIPYFRWSRRVHRMFIEP
jgi:ABC-type branched-subunit amino acid transport system permease subunit